NEANATACVLHDNEINIPLTRQLPNAIAHLEYGPMAARHMQEIDLLFVDAADGDRGVIVADAGLSSRGTRQNDPPKLSLSGGEIIARQPCSLDHIALGGCRILVELRGKQPASRVSLLRFDRPPPSEIGLTEVAYR